MLDPLGAALGLIIGIVVTVALIAVAIVIAVPGAVESGIRRALPDEMLRPLAEPTKSPPADTECLQCGAFISAKAEKCWKCGWTYSAGERSDA